MCASLLKAWPRSSQWEESIRAATQVRDEALQKYEENVRQVTEDDGLLGLALGEGLSSKQWQACDLRGRRKK